MFFIGFNVFRGLFGLLMLPLAIWAGWWSYQDAARSGRHSPWLWAGISFSVFPVGFIIYLLYRVFARNKK